MGISFCESRRIDDVCLEDIKRNAESARVPDIIVLTRLNEMQNCLVAGLRKAGGELLELGFENAPVLAEEIAKDCEKRFL